MPVQAPLPPIQKNMQEGSNNAMSPEKLPEAIFRFLDKRNQPRSKGGGGKTLHHHVLQPKSSIHRVRHVLAKARRT